MIVAKEVSQKLRLRKSLLLAGLSSTKWYHKQTPRDIPLNNQVETVREIGSKRLTYGTRRMAAAVSRELKTAANRKQIRKVFHKLGWIEPKKTKKGWRVV